jgi:tetrapyrrole methylase family protein / MazG family protein
MPQAPRTLNQFDSLVQVLKDLRGPDGCPWDKEQNHQTLTPYAIEEVHEMVEAIESGVDADMQEELGDVLFQVVLHAQIANERQAFNIQDVIESIVSKIVRRHPHVFSNTQVKNAGEVMQNWEAIKQEEKKNKPKNKPVLDVPPSMPALQRSHKIGEKTEKYKFDWTEVKSVIQKLKSEIIELEEAIEQKNSDHIQHEMGDVLFSAAQVSRHLNLEPESSLRQANNRFSKRFEAMIKKTSGLEGFTNLPSEEKEKLWKQVKRELE